MLPHQGLCNPDARMLQQHRVPHSSLATTASITLYQPRYAACVGTKKPARLSEQVLHHTV